MPKLRSSARPIANKRSSNRFQRQAAVRGKMPVTKNSMFDYVLKGRGFQSRRKVREKRL
jgi:hypothetical protein